MVIRAMPLYSSKRYFLVGFNGCPVSHYIIGIIILLNLIYLKCLKSVLKLNLLKTLLSVGLFLRLRSTSLAARRLILTRYAQLGSRCRMSVPHPWLNIPYLRQQCKHRGRASSANPGKWSKIAPCPLFSSKMRKPAGSSTFQRALAS